MARKKTIEAIENEQLVAYQQIRKKVQEQQTALEEEYAKLEDLQKQKRRIEADTIMEAYLKSGKNFDEIMTFLSP